MSVAGAREREKTGVCEYAIGAKRQSSVFRAELCHQQVDGQSMGERPCRVREYACDIEPLRECQYTLLKLKHHRVGLSPRALGLQFLATTQGPTTSLRTKVRVRLASMLGRRRLLSAVHVS